MEREPKIHTVIQMTKPISDFTGILSEIDNSVLGKHVASNANANSATSALLLFRKPENYVFAMPKPNNGHERIPLEILLMCNDSDNSKKHCPEFNAIIHTMLRDLVKHELFAMSKF